MKTCVYLWHLATFQLCWKPNTHFTFSKFYSENCVICEIMWYATPDMSQTTVPSIHLACWIPKATNTLRMCNTVLDSFPRQQLLSRSSSECGLLRKLKMGQTFTTHIGDEQFHWDLVEKLNGSDPQVTDLK